MEITSSFCGDVGMKGTPATDFLTGALPEISRLIMIIFLGKVERAIRSGINSRFIVMGFSARDAIWDL